MFIPAIQQKSLLKRVLICLAALLASQGVMRIFYIHSVIFRTSLLSLTFFPNAFRVSTKYSKSIFVDRSFWFDVSIGQLGKVGVCGWGNGLINHSEAIWAGLRVR